VEMYQTSLTGDYKTAQEGFIHDSGNSPVRRFTQNQSRFEDAGPKQASCDGTDMTSMLTRERNAPVHRAKDGAAHLSDKPSTSVSALASIEAVPIELDYELAHASVLHFAIHLFSFSFDAEMLARLLSCSLRRPEVGIFPGNEPLTSSERPPPVARGHCFSRIRS